MNIYNTQKAIELERGLKFGLRKGEDEFFEILNYAGAKEFVEKALESASKKFEDIKSVSVNETDSDNLNIELTFK